MDDTERRYGPVEPTRGWQKLEDWLSAPDPETGKRRSQGQLSKLLDVSQPAVRGWVCRLSRPSEGPLRDAVCRVTGASPEDWETSAEKLRREELDQVGNAV